MIIVCYGCYCECDIALHPPKVFDDLRDAVQYILEEAAKMYEYRDTECDSSPIVPEVDNDGRLCGVTVYGKDYACWAWHIYGLDEKKEVK